jgi:glycosyltransferase involved in cell wall biosynthesis
MRPDVSVVVPARNAASVLSAQLRALADQDFGGAWEVIVSDNGSTDDTRRVALDARARLPGLRVVDAGARPGVAVARNRGAEAATGRYVAFCDADDVVSPWWLSAFMEEGSRYTMSYGPLAFFTGDAPAPSKEHIPPRRGTGLLVDPFAYLPFASGGNFLIDRSTLVALGGFREDYGAGEDVDLCWRAQYMRCTLGFAPQALVYIRQRRSSRAQFRQYFGYGRGEVQLYRDHRPYGMPRSSPARAVAVYGWLLSVGLVALARRDPYHRHWVNAAGRRCGRLAGSIAFRRLYL